MTNGNGSAPPSQADASRTALTAVKAWLAELPPTVVAPPDTTTQLFNDLKSAITALHLLRLQAVDAAESLRLATISDDRSKAFAEQATITAAGGDEKTLGTNEAARKRALTLALESDEQYLHARRQLLDAKYQSDLIAVELQHQLDLQSAVRQVMRLAIATCALNPGVADALAL